MNFKERLKKLMQDKKVTGYRLAQDLDIPNSTLRNWLSGRAEMPRDSKMEKLANYFGIDIAWLRYGNKQRAPVIIDVHSDAMRLAKQIEQYLIQHPSQKNKIEALINILITDDTSSFKKNIFHSSREKLKK